MIRLISFLFLTGSILSLGCSSAEPSALNIDYSDNGILAVSMRTSGDIEIILFDVKENKCSAVIQVEDMHCLRPTFSRDGKNLFFVAMNDDFDFSEFMKYSIDEGTYSKLAEVPGNVRSMTVDQKENIYFTTASVFTNYSPLAKKAPHGYNIFWVEKSTDEIKMFMRLNAYSMGSLTLSADGKYLITNLQSSKNENYADLFGMIRIEINSKKASRIKVKDNPRQQVKNSCYPYATADSSYILFIAPYELYGYNLSTKVVDELIVVERKKELDGMFIDAAEIDFQTQRVYFLAGYPNRESKLYQLELKSHRTEELTLECALD